MNYRCISPQLKSSCYNCKYYKVSDDMLNGLCFLHGREHGKAAIGIGTCNEFAIKGPASSDFAWQQVIKSGGMASANGNEL